MQQRYYDPLIGRFLSVDPIEADADTGDDFNRYAYAYNNPYAFTDPDGRQAYPMTPPPLPPPPPPEPTTLGTITVTAPQPQPTTLGTVSVIGIRPEPIPIRPIQLPPIPWSAISAGILEIGPRMGPLLFFVSPDPCPNGHCGETNNNVMYSKGGNQNVRDTGLIGVSNEEIARRLKDPGTSGTERKRLQREQKGRGQRNKTKREK